MKKTLETFSPIPTGTTTVDYQVTFSPMSKNYPDDRPPLPTKRKSTKQWCKGIKGREHVPEIVIPENAWKPECFPSKSWYSGNDKHEAVWWCHHVEMCTKCGKHLKNNVPCPDKPEGIKQMFLEEDQ